MLYCWHCNSPVTPKDAFWFCSKCGQHGDYDESVKPLDWREGSSFNMPYAGPDEETVIEAREAAKAGLGGTIDEILE